MNTSPNSNKENVIGKLQTAIKTLERYKLPEKKRDKFRNTIKGIVGHVTDKFLLNSELTPDKEITEAIETLKNNYQIIQNFEKGTAQEKDLANHALQSIRQFNEMVEKRKKSTFWSNIFSSFNTHSHLHLPRIDLPFHAKSGFEKCETSALNFITLFNSTDKNLTLNTPSNQEKELFMMKTITLLKEHFIPINREILKETPILMGFDEKDTHIILLQQKLSLFPGEDIFIKGKIYRNGNSTNRSTPIPDSFTLSSKAIQSGFPHSLLYHGWALSEELIPSSPHFLSNMPLFEELIKKMRSTAEQLLPTEPGNRNAKKILEVKKSVFNSNAPLFLNLHQEFTKSFIQSREENSEIDQIIDIFFNHVRSQKDPYSFLSKINQTINEKFISFPYKSLQEARLNNQLIFNENASKVKDFLNEKIYESLKEIETKIDSTENEIDKEISYYIFLIGTILSEGIIPIIMQEMSEILSFPPPLLNEFSRKIQTWTYNQLTIFIDEVQNENFSEETIFNRLKNLLERDISIFKQKSCENTIETALQPTLNEIEQYYNKRYSTKKRLTRL